MIARFPALVLVLVLSFGVLLDVPPAAADDEACDNLISLPGTRTTTFTISSPGIYCLDTDVIMAASFTAGNAIEIAANYVTLNLKGHKVHGAAAGAGTQANGIHAVNRRNVTVKNGTVWGFFTGILLDANPQSHATLTGYLVEGIRAELNRFVGIQVVGANSIVRRNVVANTGPTQSQPFSIGILLASSGGRVLDNDVLTVTGSGGVGNGIGIGGPNTLIAGNRITSTDSGLVVGFSSGKYRDNLTVGVGTPYSGGTDAGNND